MKRIVILIVGLVAFCGCSTLNQHKSNDPLIDVPYGETQKFASLV